MTEETVVLPRIQDGPRTLHQATMLDPYQLLRRLDEQAALVQATARPDAGMLVAELALAAGVQQVWLRLQMPMVHRALVAGARMDEIAAALGARPGAVGQAWWRWAARHAEFTAQVGAGPGTPLVTWAQIDHVVGRHAELWPGGLV